MNSKTGTLQVVATPIGNLGDVSQRAKSVLGEVDLILAEDTRHAAKLLDHLGISTPTRSFHEHNEDRVTQSVLQALESGSDIALISDAGTPLISDPGYRLVAACRAAGIAVSPVPGSSALIAALCVAGLPTDRFGFHGFLPSRSAQRRARLVEAREQGLTAVFYESSHRIVASLQDIATVFSDQARVLVAREMTKKFESFYSGTPEFMAQYVAEQGERQKGEFVVVISSDHDPDHEWDRAVELLAVLLAELPAAKACAIAASTFGVSRNRLYDQALKLKQD